MVGARIGWVLFGLATTGMVWADTTSSARWTATGVAVLAWSVCSVLALHGLGRRRSGPDIVVVPPPRPAE